MNELEICAEYLALIDNLKVASDEFNIERRKLAYRNAEAKWTIAYDEVNEAKKKLIEAIKHSETTIVMGDRAVTVVPSNHENYSVVVNTIYKTP